MFLDHEIDTDLRRAFLAGLGKKNDVAIQFDAVALQHHHDHQACGDIVLVIERAATVYPTILACATERVLCPAISLHADDIGMTHDQYRPFAAITFYARNEIGPFRFEGIELRVDAVVRQNVFQIICDQRLITRRVRGIDAHQLDQVADRFFAG